MILTCRDCIHWEACSEYQAAFWGHKSQVNSKIVNASPDTCPFFHDSTTFMKLPCKIGDTVYVIERMLGVTEIVPFEVKSILITNNDYRLIVINNNYLGLSASEIGKTVFFTREKAEQVLKGREHDDLHG